MTNVLRIVDVKPALEPDAVLADAMGQYESVVVIGWDADGELDVRASLNLNLAQINFLLDMVKARIISGEYAE